MAEGNSIFLPLVSCSVAGYRTVRPRDYLQHACQSYFKSRTEPQLSFMKKVDDIIKVVVSSPGFIAA